MHIYSSFVYRVHCIGTHFTITVHLECVCKYLNSTNTICTPYISESEPIQLENSFHFCAVSTNPWTRLQWNPSNLYSTWCDIVVYGSRVCVCVYCRCSWIKGYIVALTTIENYNLHTSNMNEWIIQPSSIWIHIKMEWIKCVRAGQLDKKGLKHARRIRGPVAVDSLF